MVSGPSGGEMVVSDLFRMEIVVAGRSGGGMVVPGRSGGETDVAGTTGCRLMDASEIDSD